MLAIQVLFVLMFSGLPPTSPKLPLIVLKTAINPTANVEISHSVTIASSPQAVGYSSWLGYWQSFNGVVMTTAPDPNGGSNQFPNPPSPSGSMIVQ